MISHTLLLDKILTSPDPLMKTKDARPWKKGDSYTTKKFFLDGDVYEKIRYLQIEHGDFFYKQLRFAVPPFDDTYVEAVSHIGNRFGILRLGNEALVGFYGANDPENVEIAKMSIIVEEDGSSFAVPWKGTEINDKTKTAMDEVMGAFHFTEVLWLLMHRPGAVKRIDHPDRKVIGREGFTRYLAHSVLTIDLAKKDIVQAIHQNGHRGAGVREHNVMGHWVHLHHDRRCTHVWERRDRPEGQPARYDCHQCGTSRVWRKDFVRGDASLGKKMHTYEVTDSRLKKVGHDPLNDDRK